MTVGDVYAVFAALVAREVWGYVFSHLEWKHEQDSNCRIHKQMDHRVCTASQVEPTTSQLLSL